MKSSDIEFLKNSNLITAEQAERIYVACNLKKESNRSVLPIYLGSLGLLFIISGLIAILVDNWDSIANPIKPALGIIIMGAAWGVWAFLQKKHPTIAEIWALIGVALWGVNIAMVETIFQISPPFCESLFIFFCGVVALPFLSKQRLLFWAVVLSSFLLLLTCHEKSHSWLSISDLSKGEFEVCTLSLLVIWTALGERWHCCTSFLKSYRHIGEIAMIFFLIFGISCTLQYTDSCMHISCTSPSVWCIWFISCFFYIIIYNSLKTWQSWLPMAIFLCFSLPIASLLRVHFPQEDYESLAAFVGTVYSIFYGMALCYYGYKLKKIRFINYGVIIFVLAELAICSNAFGSLSNSGSGLLICGLFMLLSYGFIEKYRRRFIKKLQQ